MLVLHADKSKLTVRQKVTLTSGAANAFRVRIQFSEDWDGMERTAVFRAGNTSVSVLLDRSGECAVPWEVLEKSGLYLQAGVRGIKGGDVVLPTVWASLGFIQPGTEQGKEGRPPTSELWRQELDRKGDRLDYTEDGELGLYAGEKLLSAVTVSKGRTYEFGSGLTVSDGTVRVDTADDFDGDNTRPITAAAVRTITGNIDALLSAI